MLGLETLLPAIAVDIIAKIGTLIGPFVAKTFEFLASKIPIFLDKIELIINVAEMVFEVVDIKTSNEVLGQKASRFDESTENYNNLCDYIDTVEKADIRIEEKKELSTEEYHVYRALGMAIRVANLAEKMNYEIKPEFIAGIARLGIENNHKLVKEVFNLAKEEKKQPDIEGYLDNKLDANDEVEVYNFLDTVLKKSGEEKTVTELLKGAE